MKLVVDMNLSPEWVGLLSRHGWLASHWSEVGDCRAPDSEIMRWARENESVVITQDLDFSHLLFATAASGPSVVLLRLDNEFDDAARERVCASLALAEAALGKGALLTISESRVRIRLLPIADKGS